MTRHGWSTVLRAAGMAVALVVLGSGCGAEVDDAGAAGGARDGGGAAVADAGRGGGGASGPADGGRAPGDAGSGADAGGSSADGARGDAGGSRDDGGALTSDGGARGDAGGVAPDGGTDASVAPPDTLGPFALEAPVTQTLTRERRRIPVTVYVPRLPAGTRAPLVLFLPGFQLDAAQYAGTLRHLASHGFVVAGADPSAGLLSANHVAMAADGRAVLDWATGAAPFAGVVEPERVAVAGHSLGGKLATLIALDDSRVRALLAFDPVDGDPSPLGGGSPDRPDLVPTRGAELDVPAGFLGETTNSAAGGGFGAMACAPAAQNFQQFYAAATQAPWAAQWTLEGADHMDFLDDPAACGLVCRACPDGPAEDGAVVAVARTLATAFLRLHLRGEGALEPWLTGASLPPGVAVAHRP